MTNGPDPHRDVVVAVTVVRSGGVAGITRRWGVDADPTEAERWIALIVDCPWDDLPAEQTGADRFVWTVEATLPETEHRADLGEREVTGPWRALIDAVRAASSAR